MNTEKPSEVTLLDAIADASAEADFDFSPPYLQINVRDERADQPMGEKANSDL